MRSGRRPRTPSMEEARSLPGTGLPGRARAWARAACVGMSAGVLVVTALSGCTDAPPPGASSTAPTGAVAGSDPGVSADRQTGRVFHVVDGDTVDVTGVGRIRVIGIDTPERGECGYESATLAMAALVNGRVVTLVAGAQDDADRYGRLLRYVDVGSTDAGLALIEQGWAIARYDSRDGYGHHAREEQYVAADAASEDLGCYPD